jgi:hypothetical protein
VKSRSLIILGVSKINPPIGGDVEPVVTELEAGLKKNVNTKSTIAFNNKKNNFFKTLSFILLNSKLFKYFCHPFNIRRRGRVARLGCKAPTAVRIARCL